MGQTSCEDALAYAIMRMQFGEPIASFQSMKHKQADMLLEVELAKSAAYYAAASLDDGDDDAAANAHLAKVCASDAYMQTAIHAVQIHDGIGFTGTVTHISGSSGQKAPRCCWVMMPTITAN